MSRRHHSITGSSSIVQVEGGIPAADWWAWVSHATPFQALDESVETLAGWHAGEGSR